MMGGTSGAKVTLCLAMVSRKGTGSNLGMVTTVLPTRRAELRHMFMACGREMGDETREGDGGRERLGGEEMEGRAQRENDQAAKGHKDASSKQLCDWAATATCRS